MCRNNDKTRMTTCTNLSQDLEKVLEWVAKNLQQIKTVKTQACTLSKKKLQNVHPLVMNVLVLVTIKSNQNCHES